MTNTTPPEITRLTLADLPQLINCVRSCYGESYPNKMMYDINQLEECIENKLMHSVVAKRDNGQIVGHCALTFDGAHNVSPEAGKMMVDPNFRGQHIAEKMAKERIEIAQELALPGFWTECVTNHPYSQYEMIAFNAKETGLFIGNTPGTISMKGLENHPDTRMSLLAFYLQLNDRPHTIFMPAQHAEHTTSLVKDLNLQRNIVISSKAARGTTTFHAVINSSKQTAKIAIDRIGSDLVAAVKHELLKLEPLNLASIYLDIPIEQETAANAYLELESIGFFWGSWMPNFSTEGDALRLQKIYQPVDINTIICARPQGESVKDFIVSEWERVTRS
jgi:RimJ/RimL family protein N-acetyltransferase